MSDPRFFPVDVIETERESVREPAKRWRNWFEVTSEFRASDGCNHVPGDRYAGEGAYPSKDIAESAVLYEELEMDPSDIALSAYLGAFPEGESP